MDALPGGPNVANVANVANAVKGTGGCDTRKLKDLTLIIHCRQGPKICELRRPLLMEYVPYFKDAVVFLKKVSRSAWPVRTRRCLERGDPYLCIALEVPRAQGSAGIVYMQFDVAISPCGLAKALDTEKIFKFTGWTDSWVTFDHLDDCNRNKKSCLWFPWIAQNNVTRKQWGKAFEGLERLQHSPSLQHLSVEERKTFASFIQRFRTGLVKEWSDFMYIPKSITSIFAAVAKVFAVQRLFNEMATTSAVMLAAAVSNVTVQNLSCVGSCCTQVARAQLLDDAFICGHRFKYTDPEDLETLRSLISQRPVTAWSESTQTPSAPSAPSAQALPSPTMLTTTTSTDRPTLTVECSMAPFEKVLVILHCTETFKQCNRQLLQKYAAYFPEAVLMLPEASSDDPAQHCDTPVACVQRCLSRGLSHRGLLYVQLDVAVSPCALLQKLQLSQSAWGFGDLTEEGLVTYQELESSPSVNRTWLWRTRSQLRSVAHELEGLLGASQAALVERGFWQSPDSLFYIPKEGFRSYATLADMFAKVGLEGQMASATLLALSSSLTSAEPVQNLHCDGSEIPIGKETISAESFLCGRYREDGATLEALDNLLGAGTQPSSSGRIRGTGLSLYKNNVSVAVDVSVAVVVIPLLSVILLWLSPCRRCC